MECHHRAFACPNPTLRVVYLDLVYQWRPVAEELEAIEIGGYRRPRSVFETSPAPPVHPPL
jgi:hypothetical protein